MTAAVASLSYSRMHGWSCEFPPFDGSSTLVVVFGSSDFEEHASALRELRSAYPRSTLLGCSTAGEIYGGRVMDRSLSVGIIRFEAARLLRAEAALTNAASSRAAGEALARKLAAAEASSVILLSDGLAVNGSELARGLVAELPGHVGITGALAGDGDRFRHTWVLDEDANPRPGLVTAVGLSGAALRVSHGSRGGWDVFGPRRLITRARGNVLYELDGAPALELYKKYLGERAAGLPGTALLFPLEVRSAAGSPSVVRTVLAVDERTSSMTFAGDIPEGHHAQLMRANFDRLIDGAAGAANSMKATSRSPGMCIAISCVGRRLVLGERVEEEAEAVLHSLPTSVQQVGMYSYGELSTGGLGSCELHNQTMTVTLLQEDAL